MAALVRAGLIYVAFASRGASALLAAPRHAALASRTAPVPPSRARPSARSRACVRAAGGARRRAKRAEALTWQCVQGCGACCYLDEAERPGLDEWLGADDLATYRSMVGADGWCKHYDAQTRACTIYERRPWFCQVSSEHFARMYGVRQAEMGAFCIGCCREHINGVHGPHSPERARFEAAIRTSSAENDGDDQQPRGSQQ